MILREKQANLLDDEGVILAFDATPPKRVVSLIPSMTESLFDLVVGDRVVGVTDLCTPPEEDQLRLQRVGGTKKPNLEAVRILRPDLVIANQEENSEDSVRALSEAGLTIWLTFPKSTVDALDLLWTIIKVFFFRKGAARRDPGENAGLDREGYDCPAVDTDLCSHLAGRKGRYRPVVYDIQLPDLCQ